MCKEQTTRENLGHFGESRLEAEDIQRAHQYVSVKQKQEDGVDVLLEMMLERDNLNEAYKRVKRNGGAAGVDGMGTHELLNHLKTNREELLTSIREGRYTPSPVRRVEIPKPNGGKRLLGIPTVTDRFVQQALAQVLTPIFEPTFSEYSYGFRPGRNAHGAIQQAAVYIAQGYTHAVDIDLAQYFDTVNHDILMAKIEVHVMSKPLLKLIRKFLRAGVFEAGHVQKSTKGTPQGGNLSPLFSNIYLTAFDEMLTERGHKFVRYADDCNIYTKSEKAACRVLASCTNFLESKLKLTVNQEKSCVGSPYKLKFLGFSFCKVAGEVCPRPHAVSVKRFKDRVRAITKRNRGRSMGSILYELKEFTQGWLGYFSIAKMEKHMTRVSQWIRRRLRMYIWKQWKKAKARIRSLTQLGVPKHQAYQWGHTSKSYWRTAKSPILTRSLTNEYLVSLGYDDVLSRYKKLHSTYRTAVYGTVRTVV